MISISTYNSYFQAMPSKVPQLKKVVVVATESDLQQKIKDMADEDFPVLVVVIPSADSIAPSADNVTEANTCLLYVLQKSDPAGYTDGAEITVWNTTQEVLKDVKNALAADKANHALSPHWIHDLDLNHMHTDPELNLFGCIGWSLSFTLITPGF